MVSFQKKQVERALQLRSCIEVLDYYPIEYVAKGIEDRFSSWQKEVDATFNISTPLGGDSDDEYRGKDDQGKAFDPWGERRFKIIEDKGILPVDIGLTFQTPLGNEVTIDWRGTLEFEISDATTFNEGWDGGGFSAWYLVTEIVAQELWPVIRQSAFQQFDSWRLPRPDLPWSKPSFGKADNNASAS